MEKSYITQFLSLKIKMPNIYTAIRYKFYFNLMKNKLYLEVPKVVKLM